MLWRRLAVLAVFIMLACTAGAQETRPRSLFINLTTDDVNRSSMAINLAHRMVKERKMPVTIWLNVTGVRLADKRLVQPMFSDAHTPLEKLQAFMRDGGKVMICPMCMRNMGGMEIADLPNGVVPSEVDVWEAALFADGVRTLSY